MSPSLTGFKKNRSRQFRWARRRKSWRLPVSRRINLALPTLSICAPYDGLTLYLDLSRFLVIRHDLSVRLTLVWDVGGQDKIRPLWRHYYQNTQGLIFVVDSNDRDRVDAARDELHRMLNEDELRESILLVFANKQVGVLSLREQRVVDSRTRESILGAYDGGSTWPEYLLYESRGQAVGQHVTHIRDGFPWSLGEEH